MNGRGVWGDPYSDIAAIAWENGWRSVRDLVYLINEDVLEADYLEVFEYYNKEQEDE